LAGGHAETVDPMALVRSYQDEQMKNLVKLRLRQALSRIEQIAAPEIDARANYERRGRRQRRRS
jgi:hypothetical protein